MHRLSSLAWLAPLSLTLALVACGDDGSMSMTTQLGSGDGDGDTTGNGDGDGTPGDGDGTPPGDGDGTPPGDGDGAPGDGDGTPGDGDGTPGDGDGDGDGAPPVDNSVYSAVAMPGAFDRVVLTRANPDEPTCTRMTIYHPVMFDMFDITMPDLWRIETVIAWKTADCPVDNANPTLMPDAGTGTITFPGTDALGIYPCLINVDFDLDMNSDPPTIRHWGATNIPVEGVNCG